VNRTAQEGTVQTIYCLEPLLEIAREGFVIDEADSSRDVLAIPVKHHLPGSLSANEDNVWRHEYDLSHSVLDVDRSCRGE
jgi:hypothetical protein